MDIIKDHFNIFIKNNLIQTKINFDKIEDFVKANLRFLIGYKSLIDNKFWFISGITLGIAFGFTVGYSIGYTFGYQIKKDN
jgi:hypothetical protein